MIPSRLTAQRLFALFLLGCVLFNFPVMHVFNRGDHIFGVPVMYAYLMTAWFGFIAFLMLATEDRKD
jgi:hypothetical protein